MGDSRVLSSISVVIFSVLATAARDGGLSVVDVDPRGDHRGVDRLFLRFLLGQGRFRSLPLGLGLDDGAFGGLSGGALLVERGFGRLRPRQVLVELLAGDQVLGEQHLRAHELLVGQDELALALDDGGIGTPEIAPPLARWRHRPAGARSAAGRWRPWRPGARSRAGRWRPPRAGGPHAPGSPGPGPRAGPLRDPACPSGRAPGRPGPCRPRRRGRSRSGRPAWWRCRTRWPRCGRSPTRSPPGARIP